MIPGELRMRMIRLIGPGANMHRRIGEALGLSEFTVKKWLRGEHPIPPHVDCHVDLAERCAKQEWPAGAIQQGGESLRSIYISEENQV